MLGISQHSESAPGGVRQSQSEPACGEGCGGEGPARPSGSEGQRQGCETPCAPGTRLYEEGVCSPARFPTHDYLQWQASCLLLEARLPKARPNSPEQAGASKAPPQPPPRRRWWPVLNPWCSLTCWALEVVAVLAVAGKCSCPL